MTIIEKKKNPVVFAVSDSIGETAELVTRAAVIQFNSGHVDIRKVGFVTDIEYAREVIEQAKEVEHCAIVCTIVLPEVRDYLIEQARQNDIPVIDIMGPLMKTLSDITDFEPRLEPGLVHKTDEGYFKKMEAIEFAVEYDGGKNPRGLAKADVVLIGVSRTSKTPLAMFLAHKRLKVANLPLVPEVAPPEELFKLSHKKIVGLTINPDKLNEIRAERLEALGLSKEANYARYDRILKEIEYAEGIMDKIGCPKIDVSNKAVEEIAAKILETIKEGVV